MYRQRYGGGGGYGNGYMDNQFQGRDQGWGGGGWGDQWGSGGRMNDMGWGGAFNEGGMRNRKRGFDMGGSFGPSPKMMRRDMGGPRRFNRDQNRRLPRRDGPRRGGDANRSRGASNRDDRKTKRPEKPAWKRNPYNCNFCQIDTKDKETHVEHIATSEHTENVKKREINLQNMMNRAFETNQRDVLDAMMSGARLRFCNMCYLQFPAYTENHKGKRSHKDMVFNMNIYCTECSTPLPSRIEYEKHLITLRHIRNQMYTLIEEENWDYDSLECPEEYDENVEVGLHYVQDVRGIRCDVCDTIFKNKDAHALAHCKSEEHFKNFKSFCEVEKIERPKKIEERERKKQEEEERKRLEAEKAEEEKEKEKGEEDEDEEENAGEEEKEGDDEEAENEEGGEAEEEETNEANAEEKETNEVNAEEEPVKEEEAEPQAEAPQEEEEEVATPKKGRPTRRRSARK